MRSSLRETLLATLAAILRPIVRLMLQSGIGFVEFSAIAKSVYVEISTREYGLRGRPTNMSRVSAMTGISRKEIRRLRESGEAASWTPSMESSPINVILHSWHHDPQFCVHPGRPRPLEFGGADGFMSLVSKYAGDIPAGAIRTSLLKAGSVLKDPRGRLVAKDTYFLPNKFDEDFIRGLGFALGNLGNTLAHNAALRKTTGFSKERFALVGRFERSAWTEQLTDEAKSRFRKWVQERGSVFLGEANKWIGNNEKPLRAKANTRQAAAGVGLYYFEN